MKQHISEDLLIRIVLETAKAGEGRRVQKHLAECNRCSAIAEEIRKTTRLIAEVGTVERKAPRSRWFMTGSWPRTAAALAAGFLLGLLASESLRPSNTEVVRQRILPQSPALSAVYVSCDQVDLTVPAQ